MATLGGLQGSRGIGMQQLLTFDNGLQLVQAGNSIMTRGNNYATTLTGLLATNKIQTAFPANNPLAAQLKTVANVMAVRSQFGFRDRSSSASWAASIRTASRWGPRRPCCSS